MIYLSTIDKGRIIYNSNKSKSLEFFYAGTTDYYFRIEVYHGGSLDEDKSLMFVIDKSNLDVYNAFEILFNSVKDIILKIKKGEKEIDIPQFPVLSKRGYYSTYDINELYDEESNRIKWVSESGNSFMNLNSDTIMFIEKHDNQFKIIFKNDELCKINERYPRNVCVCKSGSKSDIFPTLCWIFDQELRKIPINTHGEDKKVKILKK